MTGVKSMRHVLDRANVNVCRQLVVDAPLERFGRKVRVQLEVCDLCQRVDAGIGPARSVELEFLPAGDLADGAIDLSLDRSGVLLDLPAAVAVPAYSMRSLISAPSWKQTTDRCAARDNLRRDPRGAKRSICTPNLFMRPGITIGRPAIIAS